MVDCPGGASDGSLGGELRRLSAVVRCEWGHNETLRQWWAAIQPGR